MAAVKELLRAENDGTLSFGDYTLTAKTKKDNYEFEGDIYKVKTFSEITKLEKNGMFVYESVPGSAVENFRETESEVSFTVSAGGDVQLGAVEACGVADAQQFCFLRWFLRYFLR